MVMKNETRFFTGISLILLEAFGLGIFILSQFDWNWITEEVVATFLICSAVILYNVFAAFLIMNGSKEQEF